MKMRYFSLIFSFLLCCVVLFFGRVLFLTVFAVHLENGCESRKSNVLAKIVIPRLNVTSYYILAELEEKEREEVFRLKRVKQKKDFEKKLDEIKRRKATEDSLRKDDPSQVPPTPSSITDVDKREGSAAARRKDEEGRN